MFTQNNSAIHNGNPDKHNKTWKINYVMDKMMNPKLQVYLTSWQTA